MLRCKLSGQVVNKPVITPCHHIFERSIIEDYISNSGTCPICGSSISTQDLFDIEIEPVDTFPATIRATSFTSLLSSLQSEWDAVQNELYNLRVKLATAQRELAQALYENDAAKRVIARLLAEKEVQPVSSNEPQEQKGSSNLAAYFKAEASRLIKLRKKEEKACEQSSLEAFRTMNMLTVSRKGPILNRESKFTVMDNYLRNVILVGASNGLVLGIDILSGMPKEYASFDAPVVALSANVEYTRFIGADRNGIVVLASLEDNVSPFTHDCGKSVVATMIHPKEEHAVVCYEDGEIEIFNIPGFTSALKFNAGGPISMAGLHTDGLFIVTAYKESNKISIFNLPLATLLLELSLPSEVTSIALPRSNSRYIAASCRSCIRIWDLSANSDDKLFVEIPFGCSCLSFDATSFILGAISNDNSKCVFIRFSKNGEYETGMAFDISQGMIGHFSNTNNFFAIIGDHDCIDLVSSQE